MGKILTNPTFLLDRGNNSTLPVYSSLMPYGGIGIRYPRVSDNGNPLYYLFARVKSDAYEQGFACLISSPGSQGPSQVGGIYLLESGTRKEVFSGKATCIQKPLVKSNNAEEIRFGYVLQDDYIYYYLVTFGFNNAFRILPTRITDLTRVEFFEPSAGLTEEPEGLTDIDIRYLISEDEMISTMQNSWKHYTLSPATVTVDYNSILNVACFQGFCDTTVNGANSGIVGFPNTFIIGKFPDKIRVPAFNLSDGTTPAKLIELGTSSNYITMPGSQGFTVNETIRILFNGITLWDFIIKT